MVFGRRAPREVMLDEADSISEELVERLNSLGFALTGEAAEPGSPSILARFAVGSHLWLKLEPTGQGWLVGLEIRSSVMPFPRVPEPRLPFTLGRFGRSPDGVRLELSRDQVESELPALLENVILPIVDAAVREG